MIRKILALFLSALLLLGLAACGGAAAEGYGGGGMDSPEITEEVDSATNNLGDEAAPNQSENNSHSLGWIVLLVAVVAVVLALQDVWKQRREKHKIDDDEDADL